MLKDCKLLYIPEPSGLKDCWPNKKFPVDGVLCDPNLQVGVLSDPNLQVGVLSEPHSQVYVFCDFNLCCTF